MDGIWIVGDVHGCYKELEELLSIIPKNDKICFVGDLIDRGTHSKEIIELVLNKYESVIGNHEVMAILQSKYWGRNGGDMTLKSFGKDKERLISLIKEKMPKFKYYDCFKKPLLITHSFASPYWNYELSQVHFEKEIYHEDNPILWDRPYLKSLEISYPFFNVFGHTALQKVFINDNVAMIDTGCVYGHKLTALHYPSLEIIQVDSQEEKINIPLDMEAHNKKMMLRLAMMF